MYLAKEPVDTGKFNFCLEQFGRAQGEQPNTPPETYYEYPIYSTMLLFLFNYQYLVSNIKLMWWQPR